jgi:hypothetical protein
MARFSDLLGGGEPDETPGEATADAAPPGPAPDSPEDVLDRLTSYATAKQATPPGADTAAGEPPAGPPPGLDELPPVADDLLPEWRGK